MAENPKLVVLSEPLRGQTFTLANELYTIGRVESCTICIPDPTISSKHCTLNRQADGGYKLTDHGSTNGTRVNGMRVEEAVLANTDIVQLGSVEMLYDCGVRMGTTAALGTQTGINLAASSGRTSVADLPNFSPFGSRSGTGGTKKRAMQLAMRIFIGILSAGALVAIGFLIKKLFFPESAA